MTDQGKLHVVDLRVESLITPMGVHTPQPRMSWRLESDARGTRQATYRVSVASSRERLDEPDLWDSGRRSSANTLDISYEGAALHSRARAWWRVEVSDEVGDKARAESWWEMGLLEPSDWSACWLAAEGEDDRADREAGSKWVWGDQARHDATRKFRLVFSLDESADVVVLIAGRDRLDGLWIDGTSYPVLRPADIDFVAPPMTEAQVRLTAGQHVIAAEVSFNPNLVLPSATGRFCALIRLRQGAQTARLKTPGAWRTSTTTDKEWRSPAFDDSSWEGVRTLDVQQTIPWPARPAIYARREFTAREGIRSARLYATALGAFEASLNGCRVDDALLAPEYTDYRRRTPYRVYDVTSLLRAGSNAIGLHVGDGWFASACAPGSRYPFVDAPRRFLAQLEISHSDGSRDVVISDEAWRVKESAVRASEIYNGEAYDARLEEEGWDSPAFERSGWRPSLIAGPPPGKLQSDITPCVRVIETLAPQGVSCVDDGVYLYDFGQNFAGVPRLGVTAESGSEFTMRFGELMKDGRLDQSNLRAARSTDTYICRGDSAGETYQPHFTFHGFRYAEVTGPKGVAPPKLTACVVHSDLPLISELETADAVVAGIWRNARWSQRSNFVSIPTDCPQRDERLGWTGDAMVFWDAATLNMDVAAFTRRYLDEVRYGQLEDGAFPLFAPTPWRQPAGMGPTPGWSDAGIVLPWMTWQRTGGISIIEENWEAMTRYLSCIHDANPEMRWLNKRGPDFGDWLSVDSKVPGDATTPKDLIGTALWGADCSMMAEMADAIGRTAEAKHFRSTRGEIENAFQMAYVADDGRIGNDSQTSYILPLYFGLLSKDQRSKASRHLARVVRERGVMLTTGFIGTPFALHVLADTGHEDLAVALLQRTEYPSWGYMLRQGATTMWERWNSDTGGVQMNSFNHYAFGAVSSFIMRRVVGIDSAEPGFRRIRIRPLVMPSLGPVAGSVKSPVGRIGVQWSLSEGQLAMRVSVPANATAEVHLPGSDPTESGVPVAERSEIGVLQKSTAGTVLDIGSGHFEFGSSYAVKIDLPIT